MFYWLLKRVFLGPLLRALFRPWVKGLEHVPDTGGAILASNHLSFSDSFVLPLMVPRRVTFLAKSDYVTGRGARQGSGAARYGRNRKRVRKGTRQQYRRWLRRLLAPRAYARCSIR